MTYEVAYTPFLYGAALFPLLVLFLKFFYFSSTLFMFAAICLRVSSLAFNVLTSAANCFPFEQVHYMFQLIFPSCSRASQLLLSLVHIVVDRNSISPLLAHVIFQQCSSYLLNRLTLFHRSHYFAL